jgi:hypothetical protein
MGKEEDQNQRLLREAVKLQKEGTSMSAKHVEVLKEHGVYLKQNSKFYEDQVKMAERYLKALKDRSELTDQTLTLESNLGKQIAANNQMQQAQVTLLRTQVREADEFMNSYKDKVAKERATIKNAKEERKEIERILALKNKIKLNSEETAELAALTSKFETTNKDKLLEIKAASDSRRKIAASVVTELKAQNREYKDGHGDLIQQLETTEQYSTAMGNVQTNTAGVLKTFLGVTDQSSSFLGSLVQAQEAFDKMTPEQRAESGATGALEMMKKAAKGLLTPLNIALSVLLKIGESTVAWLKEFDRAAADFRKTTGIMETGFGGVEDRINGVQRANLRMGVSVKEAFAAQTSLNNSMASFNLMTDEAQDRLLEVTAIMGELGVSVEETAKAFNFLSIGLGQNAKEIQETSEHLMGLSKALRIPPSIIMRDFNLASQELAKYGSGMQEVFDGLAEQSKETGLEMSKLLGIAKQFDTFEAAGNSVGRLNAILGGPYLNALQMVYMTETERIQAMREGVKMSGKVFENLGRHEQQAIALAAGISSMAEANMLFNSTDAEFAQHNMELAEMQARAAEAQAAQDKLGQVMMTLAIAATPLIDVLAALSDILLIVLRPIQTLSELIDKDAGPFGPGLDAMWTGFIAWKLAVWGLGGAFAALMKPFVVFVAAFTMTQTFFEWLDKNVDSITKAWTGIAVAIAAVGLAVLAVRGAFGDLTAFGKMLAVPALIGVGVAGTHAAITGFTKAQDGLEDHKGGYVATAEDGKQELITTKEGGSAFVSEPNLMDLPKGANVHSNPELMAMAAMGGSSGADPAAMEAAAQRGVERGMANAYDAQRGMAAEAAAPGATASADGAGTPINLVLDGTVVATALWPHNKTLINEQGLGITKGEVGA